MVRYAVWTVIAVPYVAAGLSKLYYGGGLAWVGAENMKWILLRTSLAMMEFDFGIFERLVAQPDLLFVLLGCVGLLTELSFGLVLISSRARLVFPGTMILVHLGILLLQNILFVDLILLLVVFYDLRPVTQAAGRWITRKREPLSVWYDGTCGLCDRTVRVLSGFDLLRRLDFRDFRGEDLEAYPSVSGVTLAPGRLEDEMAVVVGGTCHWGFRGYRALARALPLFWVTVPLLYLPGVARVGDAVYRRIARRRHGLCPLETSAVTSNPAIVTHRAGARATLGIAFFLLSWWVTHIEFYPLTTMKMFSNSNPRPGVVSYVRAVALYEDGSSASAAFDQWIGAMADSRYRMVIGNAFGTQQERAQCDDFLAASMRAGNRLLEDGERINGFRVQLWEWNFAANPEDPSFGHIVDTYTYQAKASRSVG